MGFSYFGQAPDGFQFDDYLLFYENIDSLAFYDVALVNDVYFDLTLEFYAS